MFTEDIVAKGDVSLALYDNTHRVKKTIEIPNLIVTLGKELIASRFFSDSSDVISHIALGTNGTSPVLGDVTLRAEIGRVAINPSLSGVSGTVVTYAAEFGPGVATGALREAGLFNAATSGTMACRTVFPAFDKPAIDTLVVTWKLTIL